jgi:tyrosyl-tRNA synthetase
VDLPGEAKTDKGIRVDKLVAKVGLVASVSEAARKLKEGAVEVNGERVTELVLTEKPGVLVIRVGKKWKRVRVA